jgi:hypothetical protein
MRPAIKNSHPEPLLGDVEYTLFLEAGKLKAQTNFHTAIALMPRK